MPTVHANGIDIHFETRGAGPPLVMLHGAGSTGTMNWSAQIPLFARAFLLYLPDARGHGATRWDAEQGFTTEMLVDDLEAFADAVGLDTFHLVGFSMGAMTALTFATRRPERLRTMILGGITTEREPRASVGRHLMDVGRIERDDPAWAARLAATHDAVQGRGAWKRLFPAIVADIVSQPLLGPRDLRRVELPVMVAVGDRDPFVPVDHAWGIRRQLPDGRLLVLPDCHHEVMSCKPGLFNEACGGFYRSTETVARRRARPIGFHPHPAPAGTDAGWLEHGAPSEQAASAATPGDGAESELGPIP